ncbi:MAG: N-acetylmuramoyl-L-alanine amidase, partial [Angelakisella sp.]
MPFGSNKKLVALLGILFSAIILVTAAVAVLQSDSPLFADQSGSSAPQVSQPQVSNVGSVPSESASGLTPVVPNFPNDLPETGDSTVTFNRPGEMRAVTLTPGIDYLASSDKSQHTVQGEIDAAMQKASELTMNTVFLTAVTDQGAAYPSGWLPQLAVAFDPLAYAIDKAREKGLYVYCIYPLLAVPAGEKVSAADFVDAAMLDNVKKELSAFAKSYKADGILFDQFYSPTTEKSYGRYLQSGGGIGYKEYLRTAARTLLTQAARAVRSNARGTQVGLLADADADTATDLKSWVADKLVDFLAVRAFGSLTDSNAPFGATARRWCDLGTSGALPLYLVHAADRICTDAPGWRSPDQMTKQIIEARKTAGYNGSVFQSLAALFADTQGATTLLLRFFRDEVSSDYILAELAMSRPTEFTYETYETVAIFQGATYPGIPVTLNGEGLPTNQSGYFSVTQPLKPGLNTIVLQSKDKTFTYHITRKVKVLQSISPRGRMTVEGGMELTVTVEAYQGSKVTATLAGETILLEELLDEDDDTDKDSSYLRYVGYFTAPEATTSIQKLGTISVRAVYEGIAEQGSGANITVNKQPEIGSGTPVRVTVAQAETFPAGSLNDYASPDCYPLPKGALDFAVGDEIIFSQGNSTYRYYMLESGRRVYSSSVATSNAVPRGNVIQGMSITNDGRYTSVVLSMLQTVSYTASYSNSGMSFQFHYTDKVPGNLPELTKNPLFSAAVWKDSTLTLPFRIGGGMLGYRASYDEAGKTLILRFNNVPATLGEARIVLDPGHGGSDPGALGNISGKHESYLNAQIALKLEAALKNAGASVYRISTDSKVELPDRVAKAYAYDPQLFISIHCNSALNTAAQGHEVYFFYPFSRGLAASVNRGIGSGIPVDRGAKYGLFYVTRTPHYGAVLSESGFVSNYDEYSQLLNSSVQQRIASGIVSSLGDYLAELSAGSYPQGTEKTGTVVTPP